ncbi:MAG TPA: hypothetical protein VK524_13650 [Polyangiaceae bacterium]|nr:hypothetical protein [Polyangiaceae bacterium]
MRDDGHEGRVDDWLAQTASLPSEALLQAWERAFGALWQRTHQTLGEVTLTAILDRVLRRSAKRYPRLACLQAVATGISCKELSAQAGDVSREELVESVRYAMLEFLTVLGNLTAGILTEALHATLAEQTKEVAEIAARVEPSSVDPTVHVKSTRKRNHV